MTDLAINTNDAEYVDRLIDQVAADPNRVEDVKKLLRHKMAAPERLNVVKPAVAPAEDDDVEDLWDNVPI